MQIYNNRILLVEVPKGGKISEFDKKSVPTHLLFLGTMLKSHGFPVELISLIHFKNPPQNYEEIAKYNTKLIDFFHEKGENVKYICLSAYSSLAFLNTIFIGRAIRYALPEVTIILGGNAVTMHPEDFQFENAPWDYLIRGEADYTLCELIQSIENGEKHSRNQQPQSLYGRFIEDLNNLPIIDYSLLDNTLWMKNYNELILYIYGSRGCPYSCNFCSDLSNNPELAYRKKHRTYSIENVIKNIENIKNYFSKKRTLLIFGDPVFGAKRDWKNTILQYLIPILIDWKQTALHIEDRVEGINEECVKLYSQADITIFQGVESGSRHSLSILNKTSNPGAYLEKVKQNVELLEKYQVYWQIPFLWGFPGETHSDLEDSRDYFLKLFDKTQYGIIFFNKYQFIPGSQLFNSYRNSANSLNGTRVYYPDWYWYISKQGFLSTRIDNAQGNSFEDAFRYMLSWGPKLCDLIEKNFHSNPNKPIGMLIQQLYLNMQQEEWNNWRNFLNMPYPDVNRSRIDIAHLN